MENNPDPLDGKESGNSEEDISAPEDAGKKAGDEEGGKITMDGSGQVVPAPSPVASDRVSAENVPETTLLLPVAGIAPFGELLEKAWAGLKERLGKFIWTIILFLLALFALGALAVLLGVVSAYVKLYAMTALVVLIALTLFFYLAFLVNIVILELVGDAGLTIRGAIEQARGKIKPFFTLTVYYLLMIIALFAAFGAGFLLIILAVSVSSGNSVAWLIGLPMLIALFVAYLVAVILLGIVQQFAIIGVVLENRPVREALAYAWGLVTRQWKSLLSRMALFVGFYLVILIPLAMLAKKSFIIAILYQVIGFIVGYVSLMFSYYLYRDAAGVVGTEIRTRDTERVNNLIKAGTVIVVLFTLVCILLMALGMWAVFQSPNWHMDSNNGLIHLN
jgi:hypothetical protein